MTTRNAMAQRSITYVSGDLYPSRGGQFLSIDYVTSFTWHETPSVVASGEIG